MKASKVIKDFIVESGMQDPEEILEVLCDWFDEHDETESLSEYLTYVMEGRSRGPKGTRQATDGKRAQRTGDADRRRDGKGR